MDLSEQQFSKYSWWGPWRSFHGSHHTEMLSDFFHQVDTSIDGAKSHGGKNKWGHITNDSAVARNCAVFVFFKYLFIYLVAFVFFTAMQPRLCISLTNVLHKAIKIIYLIKTQPSSTNLNILCEKMRGRHKALLMNSTIQWSSQKKKNSVQLSGEQN